MEYGDTGENFYVILQGIVSVQIRNEKITDWPGKRRDFLKLKNWRETEFETRIKEAMKDRYESY